MISPTALKWFLAVALVVTLTWKVAARADDESYLQPEILAFLAEQHFAATVTDDTVDTAPIIRATRGSCRMLVMRPSYYGADRDLVRSFAAARDTVAFVYRGRVYVRQPVRFIVADQIRWRLLRSIGASDHDPPVLAVVASADCAAGRLPWGRIK